MEILLRPESEKFVADLVEKGPFASKSEVIEAGLTALRSLSPLPVTTKPDGSPLKVSQADLLHHLKRRPFEPFDVVLSGGDKIRVFRLAQATATPRQFIVAVNGERMRQIMLSDLEAIEPVLNQ